MPRHDDVTRQTITGIFELLMTLQIEVAAMQMYLVGQGLTQEALEPYRAQLRKAAKPALDNLQRLKDSEILEMLRNFQGPKQ